MRNLILGLSLSVAFIVGCLVRPLVVPPVRAGTNPAKWEYKCFDEDETVKIEAKANRLGRAGFELVTAHGRGTVDAYDSWCFKRRMP